MVRKPIFAYEGWYEENPTALREMLGRFTKTDKKPVAGFAVLVPHAGYAFSGPVAGAAFASVEITESAVVLSVCHRPSYSTPDFALWPEGGWETPLGIAELDSELNAHLLESGVFTPDAQTHMREHSGEMQLPFLQFFNPNVKVNVIAVNTHELGALKRAGEALADAIKKTSRRILIAGSGDMSHEEFKSAEFNRSRDQLAFPFVEKLDADGFHGAVMKERISTCGQGTFTVALSAAKALGATRGELIAYGSSARGKGVQDYVVSYAGFAVR